MSTAINYREYYDKRLYIYDIECFPNYWCMGVKSLDGSRGCLYEISEWRNDRKPLMEYLINLRKGARGMVGFNNIGYDYNVTHQLLNPATRGMNGKDLAYIMYLKSSEIFGSEWEDRWKHRVKLSDHMVKQHDLFLINHFDNKNRSTSLKEMEFNLRMPTIKELPVKPNTVVNRQEADELGEYCLKHDVEATRLFTLECLEKIHSREGLSNRYSLDMSNHNDGKLGSVIIEDRLEEAMGAAACYVWNGKKRVAKQTIRDKGVAVKDIVVDYLEFDRPEFKAVHEWLLTQTITVTKGSFADIPLEGNDELAKYCSRDTGKFIKGNKNRLPRMDHLNVVVEGIVYDFGTGGIHASVQNEMIFPNADQCALEYDVKGYYPNLGIINQFFPEHLTERFCEVWQIIVDGKENSLDPDEIARFKLAANVPFGKGNSEFGPFRDLKFFLSITINGQLLLCKLAEMLMVVPSVRIFQVNTDGVAFLCDKSDEARCASIKDDWESLTQLQLDITPYSRVWCRNVNNYIAEKSDGSLKLKGSSFAYKDLDWSKDFSNLVSKMAAVEYLVNDTPIRGFIENHTNLYDFFLRTKVDSSSYVVGAVDTIEQSDEELVGQTYRSLPLVSRIILEDIGWAHFHDAHQKLVETGAVEIKNTIKSHEPIAVHVGLSKTSAKVAKAGYEAYLECINKNLTEFPDTSVKTYHQRITRYCATHDFQGESFFKVMPPLTEGGSLRYSTILSGWVLKELNNITPDVDFRWVNYEYYIAEAHKLVDPFDENNLSRQQSPAKIQPRLLESTPVVDAPSRFQVTDHRSSGESSVMKPVSGSLDTAETDESHTDETSPTTTDLPIKSRSMRVIF